MKTTVIFFLICQYCLGAYPPNTSRRFTATHFSTRDGLGNNNVLCLLQDKLGVLWVGTNFGLSRYDGYRWRNYRNTSTHTISESSVINCLLEDEKSNLWVGQQQHGLQYFDRQTFQWNSFKGKLPHALPSDEITSIARDSTGTVWFASDSGLYFIAKGTSTFTKLDIPVMHGRPVKILCDRNGFVWVLCARSVYRIETGSPRKVNFSLPFGNGVYDRGSSFMVLDADDGIIISRTNYVMPNVVRVRRDGSVLQDELSTQPRKISSRQTDHFLITSDGRQWQLSQCLTATDDRLSIVQNENRIRVDIGIGWLVNDMIPDEKEGIWWMASTNGIHKIVSSRESIHAFTPRELGDYSVRAICEVGNRIIIGTTTKLLEMTSDGKIHPLTFYYRGNNLDAKKGEVLVGSFHVISEDALLIGSQPSLFLLTLHSSTLTDFGPIVNSVSKRTIEQVWGMLHESDGRNWIGTRYNGLYRFKNSDEKPRQFLYQKNDSTSLPGNDVWCIDKDVKGRMWFGTRHGLARWDERTESFKRYYGNSSPNAICGKNIWSIAQTPNGTMWIGCHGAGISMYRDKTDDFISFTRANGYPFESVCSIIPQGNDTLWISTYDAVFRFIPSTKSVMALHSEDGLHDDNFGLKVAYGARDGRLFFGGQTGLSMISNPENIVRGSNPRILLTSVMIGDSALARDIFTDSHLETTYEHSTLLFTYGIMDFLSPQNNRIEYMLEGVDNDWMRDEGRGQVSYAALPHGEYRLRLRGVNGQGIRTKNELVATIVVLPAWWQTWWFQSGIAFALLTLVTGYVYRRRVQRLRFNKAVEKVRERERRLLASDIHDGPLQDLFGLRFLIEGRKTISDDELRSVGLVTKKVRNELSSFCSELRPVTLEKGLSSALHHLVLSYQRKYPAIIFETSITADEQRLGEEQHEAIYFVARTGITNVIKHAHASHVSIKLRNTMRGASFELRDDGVGFHVPETLHKNNVEHQFGLDLCREFADACNGALTIVSAPGAGTSLSLDVRKRALWAALTDTLSMRKRK